VLRKILEVSSAGDTVGVLGLGYKPGTPVIERSFAIDLARWLLQEGRQVTGWDPLAAGEMRALFGETIAYAESAEQCVLASNVVVVVNALPELVSVDWSVGQGRTVVDCWRCLPAAAISKVGRYVPLGCGPGDNVRDWLEKTAGDYFRLLTN
jgi:UDPglucose 6-dehydrogenase